MPGRFRSIRPAWNDFNLRDLAAQIESPLIMAHVRATSLATVQETNCHPFRYKNWLFVHNGEIFEVEKPRRDLLMAIDPGLFSNIFGTTDSEVMLHLALTVGLESDPVAALARVAALIEKVGRDHGVDESLWMTVGVSDGKSLWAVRYASDNEAPSLYHSPSMAILSRQAPAALTRFGDRAVAVVSEPIGAQGDLWPMIPQGSSVTVRNGQVDIRPFRPAA